MGGDFNEEPSGLFSFSRCSFSCYMSSSPSFSICSSSSHSLKNFPSLLITVRSISFDNELMNFLLSLIKSSLSLNGAIFMNNLKLLGRALRNCKSSSTFMRGNMSNISISWLGVTSTGFLLVVAIYFLFRWLKYSRMLSSFSSLSSLERGASIFLFRCWSVYLSLTRNLNAIILRLRLRMALTALSSSISDFTRSL